jgi:tight adherence protein B
VVVIALVGSVACVLLALVGLRNIMSLATERRRIAAAAAGVDDLSDLPVVDRANRWFRTTRVGQVLERELTLAGVPAKPVVVFAGVVGVGLAVCYITWTALAPVFGILGLSAGFLALRSYLRRAKSRRLEAFIAQMPELARVLANATNAGLSIPTAVAIAGDELDDPARSELQRVSNSLRFGADIESALDEMSTRLPSREVSVLLSTLIVCARSGGSLVSSLRDIADTLEERKETRREIRTTLAQSLATGYLVIVLGAAMLFLLNAIQPGTVEAMTSNIIGQIALVVSFALFVGGFLLIRRMTRLDL